MNSAGQALVEMAILLPLLLLMVLGIFEFGRAMYIKNTLTHAARAGARAGVVIPGLVSPQTDTGCTATGPVFQTTCQSLYSGVNKANITVLLQVFSPGSTTQKTTTVASPPISGDIVKVTVTLTGVTPVVPFIPIPSTLSGNTAMRYE